MVRAQVAAVVKTLKTPDLHCKAINLGTGKVRGALAGTQHFTYTNAVPGCGCWWCTCAAGCMVHGALQAQA